MAPRTAASVLGSLAEPLVIAGTPVSLGVSIGVALHPRDGTSAGELLRAADQVMYAAKAAGRGRAVMAEPAARA